MQNPDKDIRNVVSLVTGANAPEVQLAAIRKFFAPNAGLNHPLCRVPRGPNSRDDIIAIYQWYRDMSPKLELEVESHTWDPNTNIIWLNVHQNFRIWFSPFASRTSHFVVRLTLEKQAASRENNYSTNYLIASQDDYYHAEDVTNLMIARLATPVIWAKNISTMACKINTWLFQNVLGIWKPEVETEGMKKSM